MAKVKKTDKLTKEKEQKIDEEKKIEPETEERLEQPEQGEPADGEEDETDGDYLRQYQHKKVDGNPVVGGVESDPDKGSKAEQMKKTLLSQPRANILIPRQDGEDAGVTLSVNLNGYRLDFPKQDYLEVPLQIAEVIMESQKQQNKALQPYRVDEGTDRDKVLSQ